MELPYPGPQIYQLSIRDVFERLSDSEKVYAHYLSKAAWHGTKIVMRQTSPEAPGIFDLIMSLHRACGGHWTLLIDKCGISPAELDIFLEYAGSFLFNLSNYYGLGDRKFVPGLSADVLRKIAALSPDCRAMLEPVLEAILCPQPAALGFPDEHHLSNYYPGSQQLTRDEIAAVSGVLGRHSIEQENTRLRKITEKDRIVFEVLQASVETAGTRVLEAEGIDAVVRVVRGDHADEMAKICEAISQAMLYAGNDKQRSTLTSLLECFRTADLQAYRRAQKTWVTDKTPPVDNILGFVEPYRDPYGVRGEWEGIVYISDPAETERLRLLVEKSNDFVRRLPWAVEGVNNGKGPFEPALFESPDFNIAHALAMCSTYIWDAVNLPNYSDIRETCGVKNMVFANRLAVYTNSSRPCPYIHPSELDTYRVVSNFSRAVMNSLHELLGHGTGKLWSEAASGECNFEQSLPAESPLTRKPVDTWYRPGQTWNSVFEDLATPVEECRATLVAYFLVHEKDILAIFGHDGVSEISPDDVIYYAYLLLGVEGLQALQKYHADSRTWGQTHAQGHFAILKYLIADGNGVITVDHDPEAKTLHVRVDRSKILSDGRPALGRLLLRLHIWRCTADVKACREFFLPASAVDGVFETWREVVVLQPDPQWKFVQANTILEVDENGKKRVSLKVYDTTNEGIIQSFADRGL